MNQHRKHHKSEQQSDKQSLEPLQQLSESLDGSNLITQFNSIQSQISALQQIQSNSLEKLKQDVDILKINTVPIESFNALSLKYRKLEEKFQKESTLQEECELFRRQIDQLYSTQQEDVKIIEMLKQKIAELEAINTKSKNDFKVLQDEFDSLKQKNESMQEKNSELQMEVVKLQDQFEEQISNLSQTQKSYRSLLENTLRLEKQEIQKYKSDLDKLKKNTVSKDEHEILESQLKKLKQDSANIIELHDFQERLNRKIIQQKEQSDEDEETIKKLKLKIVELERQLEELKKQSKDDAKKLKEQERIERIERTKRAKILIEKCKKATANWRFAILLIALGIVLILLQIYGTLQGTNNNIKIQTRRDVKWSTVFYQDYGELAKLPNKQYHQLNFTKQPEKLQEYLKGIKSAGGGDFAEDIRGSIIQMCQKISWDKPFRLAILISDAPSHGKKYNDGCADNHPNDDMMDSIIMMIKQDIMFIGLNLTKYTKKMYSYIEQIFIEHKRPDLFMFVNMDGVKYQDIWKEMVSKISDASVAVTATNRKETKSKGDKPTDVVKTKDGAIEALCKAGNFYDFEKQANVQCLDTKLKVYRVDIKEESFKTKLEDIHLIKVPEDYEVNDEGVWDCIRTLKPFAFGMMQEVYLMKKQNAIQELYVIKTPLGGKTYSTLNDAITQCRSHLISQKLMKKFTKEVNDACEEAVNNGQKVTRYPQIFYSDFLILEENPNSFWIAERFFKGEFIKYNNNYGYIRDENDQLNQLAQAFSYYTFHVSNFNYMVNDVQGVDIYFTDPAINTCTGNFDDTDMGEDGQAMFMVNFAVKKEVCKDILKLLNIYPD